MSILDSSPENVCAQMALPLTLSAADSLAKISVSLATVPGWLASIADYGLNSSVFFANYDRNTRSWRTSQRCALEGWGKWWGSFPMSGMTRNGKAYRQRPSAPFTYAHANGFLPTPLASETSYRKARYSQGGLALSTAIGGQPNPIFVEWLMGFPLGWTVLDLSEMPSFRKSLKSSGARS